jgi:hypothetical protein
MRKRNEIEMKRFEFEPFCVSGAAELRKSASRIVAYRIADRRLLWGNDIKS